MEYFLGSVFLSMILIFIYGLYKTIKLMYDGRHYTYVSSYDEEGMETEVVVDWSDQSEYTINKD
jgi:hypothetical protein